MKNIKKIELVVCVMLCLQANNMYAAQESKAPENEDYRMQENPSLQNIIARNILIDFNNKIDQDTPLSQDDRDGWIDYLTNHQILFKDFINHDIHSQGNQIIKKGDLLFKAVNANNTNMTQLLLAAGANVNIQDESGWTPLHQAATYNSVEIARMLIHAGANVNIQDESGWTPLYLAATNNSVETARMLIDAGADITVQNILGWTALHQAANNDSVETARMLIAAGANVNIQDESGWTAEQLAQTPEMKSLFVQN